MMENNNISICETRILEIANVVSKKKSIGKLDTMMNVMVLCYAQ